MWGTTLENSCNQGQFKNKNDLFKHKWWKPKDVKRNGFYECVLTVTTGFSRLLLFNLVSASYFFGIIGML